MYTANKIKPVRKFVGNFRPLSNRFRGFPAFTTIQGSLLSNGVETFRPAYRCRHGPSRVPFIFCLLITGLFYLTAVTNTATAATYYLDDANGDDNNPGTSSAPWQTIVYAEANADNGSTIYLKTGNYGEVYITQQSPGRASWADALTFTPDDGASPVIEKLYFEADTTVSTVDRYLIFDGVTFEYPDQSNDDITTNTDIVTSESDRYLKFLNCIVTSTLGVDGEGHYWERKSIQDAMQFGRTNYTGVDNIVVDNCVIHEAAQCGIRVQGISNGNIELTDNSIYHTGHAGVKVEGTCNNEILIKGNEIYDELPVWNYGHTTIHHTSCIYIACHNVNVQSNIIRGGGGTNPITTYQEVMDGGVYFAGGAINDSAHPFTPGDTVTQLVTGATGIVNKGGSAAHPDYLRIYRLEETNIFDEENYIVSDADPQAIYMPGSFNYDPRDYGGYKNITVENNLFYDSRQKFYCSNFQDIGDNFKFNNNTVIGAHTGDDVGVSYYRNAFRMGCPAGGGYTPGTMQICNNVFVGYVSGFIPGQVVSGNIFYAFYDAGYKDQTWMNANFTGNTVYNWNQGDKTAGLSTFNTSDTFFTGGSAFDTYHTTRSTIWYNENWPHQQDLGNSYALSSSSSAIGYADANYAPGADLLGKPRDAAPDAGCYEYVTSDPNNDPVLQGIGDKSVDEGQELSLTISATDPNGDTITYSATGSAISAGADFNDQTLTFIWTPSYDQADTYPVTFIASDGTASDSETITITVNNVNRAPVFWIIGDKSVNENSTLSFSVSATDPDGDTISYSLEGLPTGAVFGSQTFTWTPGYDQAGTYSVTFIASDGEDQDSEPITITVINVNRPPVLSSIGNKSVYAGDLLTFTLNATDPDGETITYSVDSLPSGAAFASQTFNWTPDGSQTGSYDVTFTASDGQGGQDYEKITITVTADTSAPTVTNLSPQADSIQTPLNTLIILHVVDADKGVDANSVEIEVNGETVYSGNTTKHSSTYGDCYRRGTKADYKFVYQANEIFDFDQLINVTVNATDLAGTAMAEYSYSFTTEMRSFGDNKKINSDTLSSNSRPVTVRDSSGNIWAAWHAGVTGSRDIYVGKLTTGADNFGNSIIMRDNSADQCYPAIAVDSDDKLYVAWQDNRQGEWDIYVSTSTDGTNWSAEQTAAADPNDNQTNPAIVIDSSNNVYVVWEDDRNDNQDIYIATSNNSFVSKTVSQITSDTSDQSEPAIAVDSDNIVYVVWTDMRNSNNDIYGATSNNDSWTNIPIIPIVKKEHSQSNPAIATESEGSILHLLWVDDTPGDDDIFYAKTSGGLPTSPLTGSSIIDDTSSTDQLRPAIAVSGSTGNNLQVFVCWEDERNADDDLYFAELGSGSETNVFVDDDGTNADQSDPAINIDGDGHPYLVWTDSRNTNTDIYYAGSTVIKPNASVSTNISISSTTTLETVDGASVVVPAGAYPCDIKITISEVKNPPKSSKEYLSLPYDFGPSGIEFDEPVTITIPYETPASNYSISAYWYNLLVAAPSEQGISDVETIGTSPTLYLRFKTTHFTQFFVGGSSISSSGSSGGGGGGGCSMSPDCQASAAELLLPYIGLTVTMVALKLRDRRKRKARNITKSGC